MVGIYHVGMNIEIESALKSVDARCVRYIIWEVVQGVYHTLGEGLLA